jgi:phosphoribosylglycinamide formyltransferase 1
MTRARVVVLASGGGSNLQAIVDACATGRLNADVVGVVSDRPEAVALQRVARSLAVELPTRVGEDRRSYDRRLADVVEAMAPDIIVMAGWMRIVTMAFLGRFTDMVINLHPALPGELPGTRSIERAFAEAQAGQRTHSGVMVHYVPDEGVDCGPVLATVTVPINRDDTFETFAAAMHAAEHELLVATLADLIADPSRSSDQPADRDQPAHRDQFAHRDQLAPTLEV